MMMLLWLEATRGEGGGLARVDMRAEYADMTGAVGLYAAAAHPGRNGPPELPKLLLRIRAPCIGLPRGVCVVSGRWTGVRRVGTDIRGWEPRGERCPMLAFPLPSPTCK